jgi:hypothetical protein
MLAMGGLMVVWTVIYRDQGQVVDIHAMVP